MRNLCAMLAVFIVLLAAPGAWAETIGVVIANENPYYAKIHEEFLRQLERRGQSKRVKFIIQKPHADPVAFMNAARKLIAAEVDAVIAYGGAASAAVLREHPPMPVLYVSVTDGALRGLPLKNATGVYAKYSYASLYRYLSASEVSKNVGVLYSEADEGSAQQYADLKATAERYGFNVTGYKLSRSADISAVLGDMKVGALFVTGSTVAISAYPTILSVSRGAGVPVVSLFHEGDEPGAVIMMASPPALQGKEAADRLVRLLAGEAAKNIPPANMTEMDLIFNMKEARRVNLRIPMDLVTEATKVIF